MKDKRKEPDADEAIKSTEGTAMAGTTAVTTMSMPVVEVTNRRYQSSLFWGGPKGLDYGLLPGRLPIQVANAYPDQNSTYFVGQFFLPKGAYLTIQGHYGHLRYFSFTIADKQSSTVMGGGTFLRDDMIEPDPNSINPFGTTNKRDVPDGQRRYTVWIRPGSPPGPDKSSTTPAPAPNTLYTGTDSERVGIHLALRNYVPDVGFDGTGNVRMPPDEDAGLSVAQGLPEVTLHVDVPLPDGGHVEKTYTGEEMCKLLRASKEGQVQEFPTEQWLKLVADSWDPTNAPAVSAPMFQKFWNMEYSVLGNFIIDPVERVLAYPPDAGGAWLNNPDTVYMVACFSLAFGQVAVIKGKMPTFPSTKHGQKNWPSEETQLRYWSLTTGGTAPSGLGWATVFDEEIPLDGDRGFTIVMSRAIDRPKNAIREHGVKWIEFGGGEGYYIGARSWVNSVYIRYQAALKDEAWPHSPLNIPPPSPERPAPLDAVVMGPYYPRAQYMSKEEFEKIG
jgi:hypothetical protein